jgi:hypothetical protein
MLSGSLTLTSAISTTTALTWSANQIFTQATATSLGIINLSSASCDVKATTGGSLYCGLDSTGTGAASDWVQNYNYGATNLTLTPSTTIPVWIKGALYASSTARLQNATTTGLAITGLLSCDTIDTDASGNLKCGTDAASSGGGTPDWKQDYTFNALALNPTTSIPIWSRAAFYASSTLTVSTASKVALHVDPTYLKVMVGTTTDASPQSSVFVDGIIDSSYVIAARCTFPAFISSATVAGYVVCGDGAVITGSDGTAAASSYTISVSTQPFTTISMVTPAAANTGSAVFAHPSNSGAAHVSLATSTAAIEATFRTVNIQNATNTIRTFGFTDTTVAGNAYQAFPTSGYFLSASTSYANWWANCRTSTSNSTGFDTGIASSTVTTGSGLFQTFMIVASSTGATFYKKVRWNTNWEQIFNCGSTYAPTTYSTHSAGYIHAHTGISAAQQFAIMGITMWMKRFPMSY